MIFGPKNIVNLVIAWLAARSAERIADKFSLKRDPHNPHARASFIDPLSLSPEEFERACVDLLRWMGYHGVRRVSGPSDMGLEIICFDEYGGKVGVQYKRYSPSRRVMAREVRELIGSCRSMDVSLGSSSPLPP